MRNEIPFRFALLSAVHTELEALRAATLYTCHDCGHIGPSAPDLVDGFELVNGKSEDRVFEVCVRCGSAEIYPVGAGE